MIAGYLALEPSACRCSEVRGGIGMLMGPTGGYLWGFRWLWLRCRREGLRRAIGEKGSGPMAIVVDMVACLAFIIVTYVCDASSTPVVGVDLAAAMVTTAPRRARLAHTQPLARRRAQSPSGWKHRSPNETGATPSPVIDGR
ncbi:MAG: biotin transporter BioY [Eggerthellaceae bacterium]